MEDAAGRRSNFPALCVLAVGIVVYGNGLVLTSAAPSALWGAPLPRIGLDMLFAIVGYGAAEAWLRSGRVAPYLARWAVRAFPALVVCVLVTVFVIGPLATKLPLRAYLLDGMTRRYLGNMVLLPQLWLPRVFEGQQWVGTVNPMLWTLGPGLLGVAAVPLFGRMAPGWRVAALGACAVACAGLSLAWPVLLPHLPGALARQVVPDALVEAPFFLVGAALRFGTERFGAERAGAGLWRADLAMLCFAANWVMATWLGDWTIVLEWLTVPYMVLCFGRMAMPGLGRFGALGNPAFGLFLYAFPLQQLVVARMPGATYPILACFLLAVPAGYVSWHLVERPALRWAGPAWRWVAGRARAGRRAGRPGAVR